MKRIIASAGLVALGAAGVQAATQVPGFASVDGTKPWSISATLRGFYDDNPSTQPDGANKRDSFGFQVNPSVSLSMPVGQTALGLSYDYSLKYFEERPVGNADDYDQTHTLNVRLDRALSERYQMSVTDSFVIGQEPDTLQAGNTYSTFQRISGDNIRNYGTVTFNAQMTRLFGFEVGYANSYYNYDNEGANTGGVYVVPSNSGTLDRIEHLAHVNSRWQIFRETVGIVGYQFGQVDYTADEPIGGLSSNPVMSDDRNSRSHYGYVGLEHNFNANLSVSWCAGVRYIDYYNDSNADSEVSPYVRTSLRYNYLPDCFLNVGTRYDRNATDRVGFEVANDSFTRDAESVLVFASLNHKILPNLFGSVNGQFQNSTFNGGLYDGESEKYYLLGVNLEYRFSRHLSAEVGYNYDKVDSDPSGDDLSYDRNRVYLGVTARY